MKIGVKTYSSESFLDHFKEKADFFEIMAIQGNDYNFLKKFSLPMVIHAEHHIFKINPADKSIYQENLNSINFARKIADLADSKKIIFHPGNLLNKNCSKEQAVLFIRNIEDKRILIENLPLQSKGTICRTPDETREFLKETKRGFCFDINHAISSAVLKNLNYIKFLKEFIKLKPAHYHIGGQKLNKTDMAHGSLSDSELPLKEIISLLPKNAEITLETKNNIKDVEDDLRIIRRIIKELQI